MALAGVGNYVFFHFFLISNAVKTEANGKSCKSLSGGGVGPDSRARFLATPRNTKVITVIFFISNALKSEANGKSCKSLSGGGSGSDSPVGSLQNLGIAR